MVPKQEKNVFFDLLVLPDDVLAYVKSRKHASPAHTASLGKYNNSLLQARVQMTVTVMNTGATTYNTNQ